MEYISTSVRRFGETLLSCSIVSALLAVLRTKTNLKDTPAVSWVVFSLGLVIFTLINIVLCRRCRFVMGRRIVPYIQVNVLAIVAFSAVHGAVFRAVGYNGDLYFYMFQLAGIGRLAGLRAITSMFAFDVLVLTIVFASQIGMEPILREAEQELLARYD